MIPALPCHVAIDVGHSQRAWGSTSARGVGEFAYNQAFARVLRDALSSLPGITPTVLNEDGGDIELIGRTELARSRGADVFVSVHHDSVQPRYLSRWELDGRSLQYSDRFRGYSLFTSTKNPFREESEALAHAIGTRLRGAGFEPTLHHAEPIEGEARELIDRTLGIYHFDDLIVLKTASMPAVLVEVGVIVNREEELLLSDPDRRRLQAAAVAAGIAATCRPRASKASRVATLENARR